MVQRTSLQVLENWFLKACVPRDGLFDSIWAGKEVEACSMAFRPFR